MRERESVLGDERLLLRGQSRIRLGIGSAMQHDLESPLGDPRLHLDREVERHRSDLLEPEAVLLHEIEREPVAPLRTRRDDRHVELDLLARRDDSRQRRSDAVPHDRVPERVEPVIRELDSLLPARAPRGGARVLEAHACSSLDACARVFELVGQPANGERPHGHGVLADSFHPEGYSRSQRWNQARSASKASRGGFAYALVRPER